MASFVENKAGMIIRTEENKIYLLGEIYSGDDQYFEYYYARIESKYDEVEVYLHTPGGNVFSGNYIQNRLKSSKPKITIIVQGTAFSMGAVILLSGDVRKIVRNGFVMIHSSSNQYGGTAKEQRANAEILEEIDKNFLKDLVEVTGKSKKKVQEWMGKDTYFSAEKAVDAGLIHEIIEPFVQTEKVEAKNAYSKFTALLSPEKQKIDNYNSKLNTMKQPLITAYGLTSVTAESSDTAVIGAMTAHISAQVEDWKSKYENEKQSHEALKGTIEAKQKSEIDAYLVGFEKTHKKEQIDTYRTIAKSSGLGALKAVLGEPTGRKTVTETIKGKTTTAAASIKEGWTWDKYQKEDPGALEALSVEDFNALYKAKFKKDFVA